MFPLKDYIFFLNKESELFDKYFVTSYMDSPAFNVFCEIQNEGSVSRKTISELAKIIRRVLRDYCSGLRMPTNDVNGNKIYITMARKSKELNQSTQVVLGEYNWERSNIELKTKKDGRGIYHFYIELKKDTSIYDGRMVLDLPLLDYMFKIDSGSPLEDIDSVFQKRLENIKLKLLENASSPDEYTLKVIYKDINNKVNPISYIIEDDRIYVEDSIS